MTSVPTREPVRPARPPAPPAPATSRTSGRYRSPDLPREPAWAPAADFRAAWVRMGLQAAAEGALPVDPFSWLGPGPVAG